MVLITFLSQQLDSCILKIKNNNLYVTSLTDKEIKVLTQALSTELKLNW